MGKKTEAMLRSLQGRKQDYLDEDDDRALPSSSKKRKQRSQDPEKEKAQKMKIAATKSLQRQICKQCDNLSTSKLLIVAIGNHSYLMLPLRPLVLGHCYIIPLEHEVSSRNVEEAVWQDMRNFKKSLLQMFAAKGKDVLFLELAFADARQRRHAIVECVPIPPAAAKQAPMFFKKEIDEAEEEWSQHNSKKCIETGDKGLRGSIPANFPYFHVEFGLQRGFVHVIDDESNFRGKNFGHSVLKGLIKLPAEPPQQSVKDFLKAWDWDAYDWTKMLDS